MFMASGCTSSIRARRACSAMPASLRKSADCMRGIRRPATFRARVIWRSLLRSGPSPRDLLLADVGQTLAQLGNQRVAIGQHPLQAVDGVAQQYSGVAVAAELAVEPGQLGSTTQRVRVTGAEHSLKPRPGLLAGQLGRRVLACLLVGGAEVVPGPECV